MTRAQYAPPAFRRGEPGGAASGQPPPCACSAHNVLLSATVKYFDWDDGKNAKLRAEHGIGFEDIVFHIGRGDLLDILQHPSRYAGQRVFVVRRDDYAWLVPFVEDEHTVFLKTIIPGRKATKEYLGEESGDENGR